MQYVLFIIAVALVFDFINGMHDSANSIATVVSTRVLSPFQAVFWAAFFNFVAAFSFGTAVAKTMGKGLIDVSIVNSDVVLGGLLGAIAWNIITWYFGIPSSSSHALIGGYTGAAVARVGVRAIVPGAAWVKTLSFIVISPLLGMAIGWILMTGMSWIFHRATYGSVDRWFRRAQLLSAAAFSWSHGTNDAQKTMGIIAGLLVANRTVFADASHLTMAEVWFFGRAFRIPSHDRRCRGGHGTVAWDAGDAFGTAIGRGDLSRALRRLRQTARRDRFAA